MELTICPHDKYPILHVIVSGDLSKKRLEGFFRRLTDHPDWRPGIPILDDVSGISVSKLDTSLVRMMADEFALLRDQFEGCRFAILTQKPFQFGIVRQFITFADLNGVIPPQVFRNEPDAIKWLLD